VPRSPVNNYYNDLYVEVSSLRAYINGVIASRCIGSENVQLSSVADFKSQSEVGSSYFFPEPPLEKPVCINVGGVEPHLGLMTTY
jgi:hypothetical protein